MSDQSKPPVPLSEVGNPPAMQMAMPNVQAGFFNQQSFELMQRVAKGFAASSLVPKEYQGDVANCMIALNLAQRIGADPMMVMQSLTIVHGRPTWSAQFLIATANQCGRFTALRFEFFGEKGKDNWGCRAWAIEKETGERLEGSDVTIDIAKSEGWYAKNGSKWKTIPQQMLMYRAGSWWVRAYAPELSMGLQTAEEAHDIVDVERQPNGQYAMPQTLDELRKPAEQTESHPEAETVVVKEEVPAPTNETKLAESETEPAKTDTVAPDAKQSNIDKNAAAVEAALGIDSETPVPRRPRSKTSAPE